ncbi:sensor histidine kinase [Aequorivita echinoideorum]|uniref:histidine kinase n=1 Tax=Aequorivita echinoideorum TaxID=1549647 RepID=A0ABS5S127_9FLAO|nr:sensor histidine kinase [Aequorivita echinoideorum]MBT0606917.1 hypothetical protein [Aequorivita echinoideorum]
MKLLKLVICSLLFITNCAIAQKYSFKNFTIEDGLVSNETSDIFQDKKNRIWVTSTGGVSCFNGKSFTNYSTKNGLASNVAFSIFEDSKGRIWVGTLNNGISIIENGRVRNPQGIDFSTLGSCNDFLEAADGTIYIFFSKAIATFKNEKLELIENLHNNEKINSIESAEWYDSNTIYMASLSSGVLKWTLNPQKIEIFNNETHGINNICYSIYVDKNKDVWVGAYGELNRFSKGNLKKFSFDKEDFDKNRIYHIWEENENEFILSTEGNGFGIFNKNTGKIKFYNEAQGLPSRYIYTSIKDTEGNHWFTSFGKGIIRFRDTAFKIYDEDHGLPSNSVTELVEWKQDWLVGTDNGLVAIKDGNVQNVLIDGRVVNNLSVTSENNLLVATDKNTVEFSEEQKPKIIDEGYFNLAYKDKGKYYLFGTNEIKIMENDTFHKFRTGKAIAINALDDRYILTKISGLYQLHNNKLDTIPGLSPFETSDFHSTDVINKNELLAGSEKELFHIKLQNGIYKIRSFRMNRFSSLHHFRALRVVGNALWLGGRDVICKVDLKLLLEKDSVKIKYFKTAKNFLANDIDFNSFTMTSDSTLLATSVNGILAFNESSYKTNTQAPKLDISEILLFSEPLVDSIYKTKTGIRLPHQKNYLTFTMEAITFTNPENVHYKYRLKGLREGDTWSQPTMDAQVVFSYLPPGNYTFEFTADNGDGIWQENPYTYSFVIDLPFWKTWEFWFSTLILLGGCVFAVSYYRNKALLRRSEAYSHGLIRAQEEERTRVARELHDSVGQKLMLLTKKTKDTGNVEMESLAGNTLEELRSISRGLHPANLEKLGISAALRNMIDEIDANTNIFFTHEIEQIDALLSKEASLHLYRIIQEVLSNMVKHAQAKSAMIRIQTTGNTIETVIRDNGKGFVISEKMKTSGSLGMNTLYERAKILNSKLDIKSQINKGTTVKLTIPISA